MDGSPDQTTTVLQRQLMRPFSFRVTDSRGYRFKLRFNTSRERGQLDDGDRKYRIEPDGEGGLTLSLGDEEFAQAIGELARWQVASHDVEYGIKIVKPLAPRADVSVDGAQVGHVSRVGIDRMRITVAIDGEPHPAILAFVGVVAMVAWRRIGAEAAYQMWTLAGE